MSAPKNIKELRNRVLEAFNDLEQGKIDIAQASAISKLHESIIDGLNSEMKYSILTGSVPQISFMDQSNLIESKSIKQLK